MRSNFWHKTQPNLFLQVRYMRADELMWQSQHAARFVQAYMFSSEVCIIQTTY